MDIKNYPPENMGEISCEWKDDLGACPEHCPFKKVCFSESLSIQEAKDEEVLASFEKNKKVFQRCKTCPYSRKSWKTEYVYYCKKRKTYHPKNGGCYIDRKFQPEKKEKSWIKEYYDN